MTLTEMANLCDRCVYSPAFAQEIRKSVLQDMHSLLLTARERRLNMAEYIEREAEKRAIVGEVDAGLATTSEDLAEIIDELPGVNVSELDTGGGDGDGT